MANFRTERLYFRISDPIDGFDPNAGLVAEQLADAVLGDAGAYDRYSLSDFIRAPFDPPQWFPAAEGIKSVDAEIGRVRQLLAGAADESARGRFEESLDTLETARSHLLEMRASGREFYLLAKDLRPQPKAKTDETPVNASPPVGVADSAIGALDKVIFERRSSHRCWTASVPLATGEAFVLTLFRPQGYRKHQPSSELLAQVAPTFNWLVQKASELRRRMAESLHATWMKEWRIEGQADLSLDDIERRLKLRKAEWQWDRLLLYYFAGDAFANHLLLTVIDAGGQFLRPPIVVDETI